MGRLQPSRSHSVQPTLRKAKIMFDILREVQEGKPQLIGLALGELGSFETTEEIEQWSFVYPNGEWYNKSPDQGIFTLPESKYVMLVRILSSKITLEPFKCENWVIRTKGKWIKEVLLHEQAKAPKSTWGKFFKQLKHQAKLREEHNAYSLQQRAKLIEQNH